MSAIDTCSLCPRLCRFACPVASVTGREAAVPAQIAGAVRAWRQGRLSKEAVSAAVTLCVDCGACQQQCHLHVPLPAALRELRSELGLLPFSDHLRPPEGEGRWVAVLADDRDWSHALGHRLGEPVGWWATGDGLGVARIGTPGFDQHLNRVRALAAGRSVVVADGATARVLEAAGVAFTWLHVLLDEGDGGARSCAQGGEGACCGGAWPLVAHHPEEAARLGRRWLEAAGGRPVTDARCRNHLRRLDGAVTDAVDELIARWEHHLSAQHHHHGEHTH